ncbi:MAG: DUF4279 domain-containing protein, partial [Candidatus Baltobacteraceae bacterium]
DWMLRVCLVIEGVDPDVATKVLGVQPSSVTKVGDRLRSGALANVSWWRLNSAESHDSSKALADHLDEVFSAFGVGQTTLKVLAEVHPIGLSVHITLYGKGAPDTHLDAEQMRRLAGFNMSLDVDIIECASN